MLLVIHTFFFFFVLMHLILKKYLKAMLLRIKKLETICKFYFRKVIIEMYLKFP